jgi:hypothetical protein
MARAQIAGYTYGSSEAARSPLNEQDLDLLKKTCFLPPMTSAT